MSFLSRNSVCFLVPDPEFSCLVVAWLIGQYHVGDQTRIVRVRAPADTHRPLVHIQVGADSVAGAMQIVESHLPERRACEGVEAVAFELGREYGRCQADVAFQHAGVTFALVI